MMRAAVPLALSLSLSGSAFLRQVDAHGSMIMPPARNSVDADPGMPWCVRFLAVAHFSPPPPVCLLVAFHSELHRAD